MTAVILIAPGGAAGPIRGLMDRLASVGVPVAIVEDLATAAELSARETAPPAIMLDLRDAGAGEVEDVRAAAELLQRAREVLPGALPIVVTAGATPAMIIGCVRAGAADVVDLLLEGTASARAVVQRIGARQLARAHELAVLEASADGAADGVGAGATDDELADAIVQQRTVIEDLLKDLIRTERRAIDAEEALAARTRFAGGTTPAEARPPAVLLVEHDRRVADELADLLEAAGVATFAYVSGEEALREAQSLATTSGLDLAVVATRLPGMDGIETVRRLRELFAELPAFLMTGPEDAELTAAGEALGVLGFVPKPLERVDEVVARLGELARESAHRTRESLYLQRIKERHERVLAKYRTLPRPP